MEKAGILVLDGMGAGIGRQIVERLTSAGIDANITVVGSNSAATSNMMKPGVTAATGENAFIYNSGKADIIIGPIGIILPNSMNGEISPAMALAVAQSEAQRILIPVSNQHIKIAGMPNVSLAHSLDEMVRDVERLVSDT